MYNEQTLRQAIAHRLDGAPLVVVSNREPFIHRFSSSADGEEIECIQPASGVTTALDPVLRATHGLWVAHGSGSADHLVTDARGRIAVPPGQPSYTLKRVWVTAEHEQNYYYGFANQALWPLCHVVYQRPVFEETHWRAYKQVNSLFAEAVAEEIGRRRAFVFIQDYHFALLARYVKQRCPNVTTAQFWHIPWPNPEVFRICPWKEEILQGLLANDILGFHLRYHCLNFLETVANTLEARVDRERMAVVCKERSTRVRSFPISVDFEAISAAAWTPGVDAEIKRLRREYNLHTPLIGVGVDRLDYTKGIAERFRAIDRMLRRHPEYAGRFTFFQVGVPTRTSIPRYQETENEVQQLAEEVNERHGRRDWKPVVLARRHFGPQSLHALYRMAKVCVVSSLHDGMNLVAKEFVAARRDEAGVLLLSHFTGAARQMDHALLINPYATDEFAELLHQGLQMPPDEVRARMAQLRGAVSRSNIYRWAGSIIEKLSDAAFIPPESERLPQATRLDTMAMA